MLKYGKFELRNEQEQVAKNASDIEKIFDILDGLNVQDNVVAVDDIAIPLTNDQLNVIAKPASFIYYNSQLYIKEKELSGIAYFDVVFSITSGTVISFNTYEIQVTLSNGAMSLIANSVSTYSKTQIDSLLSAKSDVAYVDTQLALKASLNGANFTGAITSPSITEIMSGYSFSKSSNTLSNLMTLVYVGINKMGNFLKFVITGKITTDGSGVSVGAYGEIGKITIPSVIGQKIVAITGDCIERKPFFLFKNALSYTPINEEISYNKYNNTTIGIYLYITGNIPASDEYCFRTEFTILLSENLAS